MNPITIQLRNYRSIPYNNPIKFEVGEGITVITGINNVGKSNLLKFFYEFKTSITSDNAIINSDVSFQSGVLFSNLKNQNSDKNNIEIKFSYNSHEVFWPPLVPMLTIIKVHPSTYMPRLGL